MGISNVYTCSLLHISIWKALSSIQVFFFCFVYIEHLFREHREMGSTAPESLSVIPVNVAYASSILCYFLQSLYPCDSFFFPSRLLTLPILSLLY